MEAGDPRCLVGLVGAALFCCCVHSFVGQFKSRREREMEMGTQAKEFTNIYVKNLHVDLDESGLQKLFSPFGERASHPTKWDDFLIAAFWQERRDPWIA